MRRLESQPVAPCHRATLFRLAAALGDDPDSIFSALAVGDEEAESQRRAVPASATSWLCSRVFAARPSQVVEARAFLGRVLHGCPRVCDAQVICSELVTNSVRHSRSALLGGRVTVRAEVREHEYTWLEVEDQGGNWASSGDSDGGRGLEVVAALSDYWDIRGDEARRMVCARLDWPRHDGGPPDSGPNRNLQADPITGKERWRRESRTPSAPLMLPGPRIQEPASSCPGEE